jgi:outer membrane murein-binding lipoprotein Lpp
MKFSVGLIAFLSIFLAGCSSAKKEAYAAGCEAGVNELIAQMDRAPNEPLIKQFCQKSAAEAYK